MITATVAEKSYKAFIAELLSCQNKRLFFHKIILPVWGYKRAGWQKSSGSGFLGPLAGLGGGADNRSDALRTDPPTDRPFNG